MSGGGLSHYVTVITSAIAAAAAMLSALHSWLNAKKVIEIHHTINSRMSEMLKSVRISARAEGAAAASAAAAKAAEDISTAARRRT